MTVSVEGSYANAKNQPEGLPSQEGTVLLVPTLRTRTLAQGEKLELSLDRPLWIDTRRHFALVTALGMVKGSGVSFKLAIGFIVNQIHREQQFVLASFDERSTLDHSTRVNRSARTLVLGRDGLTTKVIHPDNTESIHHTPHHHESLHGFIEQAGEYLTDRHLHISFHPAGLWLSHTASQPTLVLTP